MLPPQSDHKLTFLFEFRIADQRWLIVERQPVQASTVGTINHLQLRNHCPRQTAICGQRAKLPNIVPVMNDRRVALRVFQGLELHEEFNVGNTSRSLFEIEQRLRTFYPVFAAFGFAWS